MASSSYVQSLWNSVKSSFGFFMYNKSEPIPSKNAVDSNNSPGLIDTFFETLNDFTKATMPYGGEGIETTGRDLKDIALHVANTGSDMLMFSLLLKSGYFPHYLAGKAFCRSVLQIDDSILTRPDFTQDDLKAWVNSQVKAIGSEIFISQLPMMLIQFALSQLMNNNVISQFIAKQALRLALAMHRFLNSNAVLIASHIIYPYLLGAEEIDIKNDRFTGKLPMVASFEGKTWITGKEIMNMVDDIKKKLGLEKKNIGIHIIPSTTVNAMAFGISPNLSGVVIYSGIINKLLRTTKEPKQAKKELYSILAHEIAHIKNKHILKHYAFAVLGLNKNPLINNFISREFEYEADNELRTLDNINNSIKAFKHCFANQRGKYSKSILMKGWEMFAEVVGTVDKYTDFDLFSTHPTLNRRLAQLERTKKKVISKNKSKAKVESLNKEIIMLKKVLDKKKSKSGDEEQDNKCNKFKNNTCKM